MIIKKISKTIISCCPASLKPHRASSIESGFSLVEMLIVAPIVILMIGIFVSTIVSMTGDVLSTRASSTLAYNIQDALNRIDQDVKLSGGYLATNDIILTSPQGYNNDTTNFHNANPDTTIGNILILETYTTDSNPLNLTQNLVYMSGQPNACNSAQINQNQPLMMNTIYFVKANTLWRRIVASSNYATAGCVSGSIGAPWQRPSCAPTISGTMCTTQDQRLVDGIQTGSFSVNYYTSPSSTTANTIANDSSQSDDVRLAAMQTASTVSVTINATSTAAGRNVSQSGTIREVSPNNITANTPASCLSILNAGKSTGNGVYWIDPTRGSNSDVFPAYCNMTDQGGGWTLALDLQTSDGATRHYYDTDFWTGTAQYGSVNAPFLNDYKSPAFSKLPATEIMMLANNDGATMGTAKYSLIGSAVNNTLYWMFNNLSNTTITGSRTGNSGSVGSNGRLRNDGESFIDHTYPIIINSTYQPLDATNETRLGTNYAASCGVINCNGHNYGGWGGRHNRAGWGDYYEGSAINGYCSTQGGFGTNGFAYNGNNAFDGNTTGCGASTTALYNVDMAVFIR